MLPAILADHVPPFSPGNAPRLTIRIRDPRASASQGSHWTGPGFLELIPDPTWAWDGDPWLREADRQLETLHDGAEATASGVIVVIAEAGAIPYAVSWSTSRGGVDVLLLFPRSVGKDIPPENALAVMESGSGAPLTLLGYSRNQSGPNGPRNDSWLKLFGRSRLARESHFEYLPPNAPSASPLSTPRVVEHLVDKALIMRQSLSALRAIKEASGAQVPEETLDRAQTTYQGLVVLAMHRMRKAGGSSDWVLDKLESKEWALSHGFPVARLRDVIHDPGELRLDHFTTAGVVKPVRGSSSMGVKILHTRGASLVSPGSSQCMELKDLRELEADTLRHLSDDAASRGLLIEDPVLDAEGHPARVDYKFFFSGDAPVLAMMVERRNGGIYCHWTNPHGVITHPNPVWTNTHYRHVSEMSKPDAWPDLLDTATEIYRATGFDFTRIDMYLGADGPIFGEVTPSPGNFFFGNGDKLALSTSLEIARKVHATSSCEETH